MVTENGGQSVSDLPAIQVVASSGQSLNPRLLCLATGGAQISREFWRENSAAVGVMLALEFVAHLLFLGDLTA